MIDVLFSDIVEIFSARHIIQHNRSPDLIEQLLLEILALVLHFLESLGSLWQHVLLSLFVVSSHFVDLLDQSWILDLPLLVVLLFEQLELVSLEKLSLFLVLEL